MKDIMQEGNEEEVAEKEAEAEQDKNRKEIKMKMGIGKRNKQDDKDKVISAAGDLSDKELDLVKSMIQSICQNTAPLGKSIEFINDDIESMNR